ncbi:dimethylarginine dimethylaminohydrolase family protein [Micromonospora maritima]|uniref:dimethylarginine dimethylaminohydrolase family protein n=1 Tax=Micromonospora maritima TaxID=986711 RepID=UPI001C2CE19A|nr:arginine deiminase family protein [Micromonospora maritima]
MDLKPTGSERSSLGGAGWEPRLAEHADEVSGGLVWARCGLRSEVAPLEAVLVARPPDSLGAVADAATQLMRAPVDLDAIRRQADGIAAAFDRHGVDVLVAEPPPTAPPNVIFMRDLFFMTPAGAVVGRTAARQRAGEERYAAEALSAAGVPILATVTGQAHFEGADALWIADDTVLLGLGFRTDDGGARVVGRVLGEQGVRTVSAPLGRGAQHLLGVVVPLDDRLAAVRSAAAGPELRALLDRYGYRLIELTDDADMLDARGMNLVTLAPGHVLMPSGAPGIRARLVAAGVRVDEVDVGEYLNADGGLGCLTGIVRRRC